MEWITNFSQTQPVAWAVLVLMLVAIAGLALAQIKIKGIGLGITGVLFAGILASHFGLHIEKPVLNFVREFGLILFVFTIGLQLGPGFFSSLRKQGLKLNALTTFIVLAGAALTAVIAHLMGINLVAALGLFSGATTNTPSLGAAQQMLKSLGGAWADQASQPALAYAVAYPGGIIGIIGSLLLLKFFFGRNAVNVPVPASATPAPLERMNLLVENSTVENKSITGLAAAAGVAVSRIQRKEISEVETVGEKTFFQLGDIVLAVGTRAALEKFCEAIGRVSEVDLLQTPGDLLAKRIVVTRREAFGKTLGELGLNRNCGVAITRVTRAEIEMTAVRELRLQFGDTLQIVGDAVALKQAAEVLGNRIQALNETNFLPIFLGITLGIGVGMIPIALPHIPVPVSLGLAGGPLLLALILGRVGRIGPLVWYMPASTNAALRELGMVLFLACVGLKAGESFFATAFSQTGMLWLLAGLAITVLPLLLAGFAARYLFKMDFATTSGVLSGSMTDPPALAFAHAICRSSAPLVAYATVYPLAMLLRIFIVQILALIFCR